jgi:hypothetical protein
MAALYTRDIIERIRSDAARLSADAIAQVLGWDVPRLQRVARTHGIAISGSATLAHAEAPTLAPVAAVTEPAPIFRPIKAAGWHEATADERAAIDVDPQTRDITFKGRSACVSRNEFRIFMAVFRAAAPWRGPALAKELGIAPGCGLGPTAYGLREKIEGLGLCVRAGYGYGAGYRLLVRDGERS